MPVLSVLFRLNAGASSLSLLGGAASPPPMGWANILSACFPPPSLLRVVWVFSLTFHLSLWFHANGGGWEGSTIQKERETAAHEEKTAPLRRRIGKAAQTQRRTAKQHHPKERLETTTPLYFTRPCFN